MIEVCRQILIGKTACNKRMSTQGSGYTCELGSPIMLGKCWNNRCWPYQGIKIVDVSAS